MSDARYLVDTNILVYLLAGAAEPLRRRMELRAPGSVVTSVLCACEAMVGARRNEQEIVLGRLLDVIEPLPFDMVAAAAFVALPFRRGKLDRWIAAHALSLDLTLVTNNERDFADIPDLRIENWTL
ncbi:type II toxin-antitoxin system VapC family toxin [uncultured Sphingomonas sp.]|uniref:type II toxin-antitoxin system VapC family toxin n=1 Tax=uncultured Sphingomonas sp. TaxID=158754 RepID=UPI0035CA1627